MAGGTGQRFWPLSTDAKPKQFLDILGTGQSFLQTTLKRFLQICPLENIIVVTNDKNKNLVMHQLPEITEEQIISEPLRRNTAPCVAYAANKVKNKNPNATMIVTPADQIILHEADFFKEIAKGVEFAKTSNALVTLGITPSRVETSFGYIQVGEKVENKQFNNMFKMKTFTEKPNEEMAKIFVESGEFFWNSGMFIWSVAGIEDAFRKCNNEMYLQFFERGTEMYNTPNEASFIKKVYSECQNISVDYAIIEKANNVYVLCSNFGWSDIGTWTNLYHEMDKDQDDNVVLGNNIHCYGTKGNIIKSATDRQVLLNGVENYVIVDTDDVLMICKKSNEKNIRQFLNDIFKKTEINIH